MTELKINGKNRLVDVEEDTPLLWAIRDTVGLTGTKYGCGIQQCGACTVLIKVSALYAPAASQWERLRARTLQP